MLSSYLQIVTLEWRRKKDIYTWLQHCKILMDCLSSSYFHDLSPQHCLYDVDLCQCQYQSHVSTAVYTCTHLGEHDDTDLPVESAPVSASVKWSTQPKQHCNTHHNMSRALGMSELYSARCHNHENMNIMLALTLHTRDPLDIGNNH